MTQRRQRGVKLDSASVRHYAAKLAIQNFAEFELLCFRANPHFKLGSKAPHSAWHGTKTIEKRLANDIARALGLEDFHPLIRPSHGRSAWQQLLQAEQFQQPFMQFICHQKIDFQLILLEQIHSNDIDKIPLDSPWHLLLQGSLDEQVVVILRSQHSFVQLAPVVDIAGFNNRFEQPLMRYPNERALTFDQQQGSGWRQLIALRAEQLPLPPRSPQTGLQCQLQELNILASQLLNSSSEQLAIDSYEFILV